MKYRQQCTLVSCNLLRSIPYPDSRSKYVRNCLSTYSTIELQLKFWWKHLKSLFSIVVSYLTNHSFVLTESPKPGVSTTVNFNRTPFSSNSTVLLVIDMVFSIRSFSKQKIFLCEIEHEWCEHHDKIPATFGITRSEYKSVMNKLLTSVLLPNPESPEIRKKISNNFHLS